MIIAFMENSLFKKIFDTDLNQWKMIFPPVEKLFPSELHRQLNYRASDYKA